MVDSSSKKRSLPAIPEKIWWALRAKIASSIPTKIGIDYVETSLGMSESSARKIVNYLVTMGMITDDFIATALLKEWRLDDTYEAACERIIASVYPQELKDAAPGPIVDRTVAKRWFMKTDLGEAQARQCAAMYALICEADASKSGSARPVKAKVTQSGRPKAARSESAGVTSKSGAEEKVKDIETDLTGGERRRERVSILSEVCTAVSFNVQIHIGSDMSPDQVDRVFESIGKHVLGRG